MLRLEVEGSRMAGPISGIVGGVHGFDGSSTLTVGSGGAVVLPASNLARSRDKHMSAFASC